MRYFFIKSYFIVAAVSLILFLLTIALVLSPITSKEDWSSFEQQIEIEYQLLTRNPVLQSTEWIDRVNTYQPVFSLELELISASTLDSYNFNTPQSTQSRQYVSDLDASEWFGIYTLPGSNQLLKIAESNEENLDLITWIELLLPVFLVSIAYAVSTILILKSISKPILALSDSAKAFGAGDLSARIANPKAPVEELSKDFNTMADLLEAKIKEQQLIIGAIPHELRTPLSRIRVALDLARTKDTIEELKSTIEQVDGYSDDLEQAVEDVLEFVRITSGRASVNHLINLKALLDELAFKLATDGFKIDVKCQSNLKITANLGLIRRAIGNVLSNSQRYATSKACIQVSQTEHDVAIRIWDDGPGIPANKTEDIFMAFSKLDESRNSNNASLGLGLSFVRAIMNQHQGNATAYLHENGGLCIELRWPMSSA